MVRVNQSHTLITGGERASSYLYSEDTGFVRIEDMRIPNRRYHGCSLIKDNVVMVAGGWYAGTMTEYLDLTTLSWHTGPDTPTLVFIAQMTGDLLIGDGKIYRLEELELSTEGQWQWIEIRNVRKGFFGAYEISEKLCK